ncbi:MAG: DUF4129 domain-containing protein [Anaerolineae bacterium]
MVIAPPRALLVLRPLLVALMFACIALSVAQLVRAFVPEWNAVYVVVGVFLVSLEAFYARQMVRRERMWGREWWTFRLAEWVVILVALKLVSYVARGPQALLNDIALWQQDPRNIVTLEFMLVIVLAYFAWLGAGDVARDFEELAQAPESGYFDPSLSLAELQQLFFNGGIILLIATGLSYVGVATLLELNRPPVGGLILNVLVYFVLGLLLLSQARYELLHTRWRFNDIPASQNIASRWALLAAVTLVLVAVAVSFLPTRYTIGLLTVLNWLLGLVVSILFFLWLVTAYYAWAFISWLLTLLFGRPQTPPLPPAMPSLPQAPPMVAGSDSDWLAMLRGIIFWAVLLFVVGYAAYQFMQTRREWVQGAARRPGVGRLLSLLAAWWAWLRGTTRSVASAVRERMIRAAPAALPAPPRWLRLGGLSPRELIVYFYLSTTQRASQLGVGRPPSQTAREYAERLRSVVPEGAPDVETLTTAFETARYSANAVTQQDTRRPRRSWERLRHILRSRRSH